MADPIPLPPTTVSVSWDSALEFTCQAGKHEIGIDGTTYTAPSPMQLLATALAGCMAIDLVHIIQKSRRRLTALEARFTGERAPEHPKRFVRITLEFALATDATAEQVERALQLSRETYCSVWNSMRADTELTVSYTIEQPQ
ncbi:MAG: OsmC family protein [Vicinamibacterales bacterium]